MIAVSNGPTKTGCIGASSVDVSGLSRGDRAKLLAEERAKLLAEENEAKILQRDEMAKKKLDLLERQVVIGADEAKAMVLNASTLQRKQRLDELRYAYELETDEDGKNIAFEELRAFLKKKD